jgi:hypothetical protein
LLCLSGWGNVSRVLVVKKREVKTRYDVVNLAQDDQACSGELLRVLRVLGCSGELLGLIMQLR